MPNFIIILVVFVTLYGKVINSVNKILNKLAPPGNLELLFYKKELVSYQFSTSYSLQSVWAACRSDSLSVYEESRRPQSGLETSRQDPKESYPFF